MGNNGFAKSYLDNMTALVPKLDAKAIDSAVQCMRQARDQGKSVYICGNGGSASIASQMVVDIVKGGSYERPKRFKMIALNDSIATVTAYANDVSYEAVFVEQLKNFAEPGDVLIAISGSGNSANVLRAVEYANKVGCTTIGLTSGEGGRLKDMVKLPLLVPSIHMGQLEDCFFVMTHVICYAFIDGDN